MKLRWKTPNVSSSYNPFIDELWITEKDINKGKAPAAIAHELAHRREGLFTNLWLGAPENIFWKELAVWESAMEKGLPREEISEDYIHETLGGYLDNIEDEYGKEHLQYRQAKLEYDRFVRKYLKHKEWWEE